MSTNPDNNGDNVDNGDNGEREESFLNRWSRRKQRADVETGAELAMVDPEGLNPTEELVEELVEELIEDVAEWPLSEMAEATPTAPLDAADLSAEVDEEVLTDADMPPLETLDEKSDYSMFFSKGVSDGLRRLALRKLFRSTPFNVRDGLDDYDDDFRGFTSLGGLITSDMKHLLEMKEKLWQQLQSDPPTAKRPLATGQLAEAEQQAEALEADARPKLNANQNEPLPTPNPEATEPPLVAQTAAEPEQPEQNEADDEQTDSA